MVCECVGRRVTAFNVISHYCSSDAELTDLPKAKLKLYLVLIKQQPMEK